MPGPEPTQPDRPYPDAVYPHDGEMRGIEDLPYLPVFSFFENEMDLVGAFRFIGFEHISFPFDPYSLQVGFEECSGDGSFGFHEILFLDPVFGMHHDIRKLTVVCEKQETGREEVEPSDGEYLIRQDGIYEVIDERPSLRIGTGAEISRGFVKCKIEELSDEVDIPPVQGHAVFLRVHAMGGIGYHPAVHSHPSLLDEFLACPPRAFTAPCEEDVEPQLRG